MPRTAPLTAGMLVAALAALKLILHLYAGRYYGYFVDELYNLALARHLAWGYVDVAPIIALIGRVELTLFGSSLSAIRLAPALAGAALVLLTAAIARELGGGRFAQGLAALCILLAPGILVMDHFLNVNALEPLCWMGCALLLIRIVSTGNEKLWLYFGLLAGLGLETKHSMLIFGFALVAGLLLTPQRRRLFNRWLVLAGLLAFLLFLPNLLWNIQHHFPFLELQENIRRDGRNVSLSLGSFFGQEILAMLPLSAPVWIAGLWWLLRGPYRVLAFAFAITTAIIFAVNPRTYYLFPAFPMLFAAGGVQFERWLARPRLGWIKPAYCALMVTMGALLAPTLLPLLPPEVYIRYVKATRLEPPRIENHKLGPLPQLFADQFGWEDMAAAVARVYHSLPADIRPRTAILGQNYGQAGAIDLFGPKYGLPPAISGHQNYFLWGPRGATGESMIVMGDRQEVLESKFASVQKVARAAHPYAMPYEHIDIFYCRGFKFPLAEAWPKVKNWH
ncbi:MAG: glycosyltransferase family 39 protein [Candidatus Solibacter sp.]|nr:glycosyltransferase family 39 protein [Candidatus Solibacter sp.]